MNDLGYIEYLTSVLELLGEDELQFLCITHFIVSDVRKAEGYAGLSTRRSWIENSVKSLTNNFTEREFNSALILLRRIDEHETE